MPHFSLPSVKPLFFKRRYGRDFYEKLILDYLRKANSINIAGGQVLESYGLGYGVKIEIVRNGEILFYVVREPEITDAEIRVLSDAMAFDANYAGLDDFKKFLENKYSGRIRLEAEKLWYFYKKVESGYGPLYPILLDPLVEEVSLNSRDGSIWVYHRVYNQLGWLKTNITVESRLVDRLVLGLSRKIGRHVSISNPIAEGLTNEGYRVSIVYGDEVSRKGSSIVIRKKPEKPWTITQLINEGVLSSLLAAYLWLVIELKGWVIVAGGVGAGKTTLLQSLLNFIPPTRRVITIEDTPELSLSSEQWDPLVERSYTASNTIDMYSLLKASLRRRPDYIVVGEVRGIEARLLVQASRLGHGVLNTIHGDSPDSVLKRLVSYPISIPRNLLGNIWTIVVIAQTELGRRVVNISEVTEEVDVTDIGWYENGLFKPLEVSELASKSTRLRSRLGLRNVEEELKARSIFLQKLVSNGVFDERDLSREIIGFYNNRSRLIEN
ncbi:type II/IV secretion system ATPase subunit [Thermogladius sp. 4427co]|uniref:type II/IV secretion system ATPase subunit n=1 Tax=Thermogladius sp. 4427co TaxID=3450718 RepID=UPI003F78D0AB